MGEIDRAAVGAFIDAAVLDPPAAEAQLSANPKLLDARFILGETPLHFLAVENYTDAVALLVMLGFDVNAANEFGDVPLVDVVTMGNAAMTRVLLDAGADPNARSHNYGPVLYAATRSGCTEIVDMLLSAGADPVPVTEDGETLIENLPQTEPERSCILEILKRHNVPLDNPLH